MYSPDCGERVLTEMDHARLTVLQGVSDHPDLSSLLSLADLVPPAQVPTDVITMHSRALIRDLAAGELQELTLCYPGDAVAGKGSTSVLSPIGAALLGRRVRDGRSVSVFRSPVNRLNLSACGPSPRMAQSKSQRCCFTGGISVCTASSMSWRFVPAPRFGATPVNTHALLF